MEVWLFPSTEYTLRFLLLHELSVKEGIFKAYFRDMLTLHCFVLNSNGFTPSPKQKSARVGSKYNILKNAQLKMDFCLFQDVAAHCDVKCMPTFQFYKNGEKVGSAFLELGPAR